MQLVASHEFIMNKVNNTIPLMRYSGKEDYESWRKKGAEKLYELLCLPFENCDDLFTVINEVDCGSYLRTEFTFQSEEGYFVPGAFLVPRGAEGPLPLCVCVQGHYSGMHISLGIEKFYGDDEIISQGENYAQRAIKEGYCAVILEQRYMGLCGQTEEGIPVCARKNAALPALLMGRTAIGERVWDVQKLLDIVEKYFSRYIQKDRIFCVGNSGGGTVTFYTACVDERIALAIPSCAVCEFEDSIIPLHHCCCNYVPGIRKYFEMGDMAGLIANRKLLVVCGVQDQDFPIEGVEKSYERAKAIFKNIGREQYCHIVKGPEGHRFYPELAWPVINELIKEK